jgi:3-isopropylmalate/(R)-2-methylmalate dehydratase small subunit
MSVTENIITGKVYVLTDNIDTDLIIPAKYLNLVPTIPEEYKELGSYALAGLPDDFPRFVAEGSDTSEYAIIVAGSNFGCGSSREHAPISLGAAGTRAVVAQSYARIYFRNCMATGELYPLESAIRLCDEFETGQEAKISITDGTIDNITTGKSYTLNPPGDVVPVIQAGGLFGYARASGMIPSKK